MINHPDWCDLTRCDAVEGDEVQDFSGAHRSTRTKTVGVVWFELVQVVAPTPQRTHLVLGRGLTREWAYPVEDLAPELLGLLGSAGYTSPDRDLDGAMHSVWLHGRWKWLTSNMTTEEREAAETAVLRHRCVIDHVAESVQQSTEDGAR